MHKRVKEWSIVPYWTFAFEWNIWSSSFMVMMQISYGGLSRVIVFTQWCLCYYKQINFAALLSATINDTVEIEAETILWHFLHVWNCKNAFITQCIVIYIPKRPLTFYFVRWDNVEQNKSCKLCQMFEKASIACVSHKKLNNWQVFTSIVRLKKVRCLEPS